LPENPTVHFLHMDHFVSNVSAFWYLNSQ
jgi:hypothetical protein